MIVTAYIVAQMEENVNYYPSTQKYGSGDKTIRLDNYRQKVIDFAVKIIKNKKLRKKF
jgi:hypothetical protein